MRTHEDYIRDVAEIAMSRLNEEQLAAFDGVKLVYGAGQDGLRGVTYYDRWQHRDTPAPFVEVCAFGQSSRAQLTGTVIHELGHVLAGWTAGHGPEWKAACEALGLRKIKAAGTHYIWAMFAPDIRARVVTLREPDDGSPVRRMPSGGGSGAVLKPCSAGVGTRGGKSRGKGSGSRMRLYECACEPPVKVRHAGDRFHAHCDCCGESFARK